MAGLGDDPARDALRRGVRSAAVVEIRTTLAILGLLENPDEDLHTGQRVARTSSTTSLTTQYAPFSSAAACWSTESLVRRRTGR